jgi:hypothetical protein
VLIYNTLAKLRLIKLTLNAYSYKYNPLKWNHFHHLFQPDAGAAMTAYTVRVKIFFFFKNFDEVCVRVTVK